MEIAARYHSALNSFFASKLETFGNFDNFPVKRLRAQANWGGRLRLRPPRLA
jgi:hypothetical protein